MEIEKIKKDPINAFLHLERYVNQRSYSRFCNTSEVSEKYTPQKGLEEFPILLSNSNQVEIIKNSDNPIAEEINKKQIFFIHPENVGLTSEGYKEVLGSPTSSTRTVLIKNLFEKPIFVKTSIPKRISRFSRELKIGSVKHSLKINNEVLDLCQKYQEFGCLNEIAGSIFKETGCLFREFYASPIKENRFLIPFFSVYSYDLKNPEDKLVIEQISEKTNISISNLLKFFLENIIKFWCYAIKEKGLLLEMHAQNTLLEVDEKFFPKRVIVRDFCSCVVDYSIRKSLNLDINFSKKLIGKNSNFSKKEEYSLVYDYLICHHFLIPMLETCCKRYNLDLEELKRYTKSLFLLYFPFKDIFTNECYGYTDEVFIDKKPSLKVFSNNPSLR